MAVSTRSGHPEWYVESLVARYQYLHDEIEAQKAKRLIDWPSGLFSMWVGGLTWFSLGSAGIALLSVSLCAAFRLFEIRQKKFIIASQMLAIKAEFPDVVQNIAQN